MEILFQEAGYGIPALFGLFFGSFANVCILRIPREESILRPRSRCPQCRRMIAWYDNLPLWSFLFLRGRARCCGARISGRYPIGELAGACLFTLAWYAAIHPSATGATAGEGPAISEAGRVLLRFAFLSYLWMDLWILSWIDAEHRIIPDSLSLSLLPAGLIFQYLFFAAGDAGGIGRVWFSPLREALFGGGVGGGILAAIAWAGRRIYKKEAMGMGDVKLMIGAGAFLGAAGAGWSLGIASLAGGLYSLGLVLLRKRRWKEEIPFGPFLTLGVFLASLGFPPEAWRIFLFG